MGDKVYGWRGVNGNKGKYVEYEDGFDYACNACGISEFDELAPDADEFREMLVEWFFSGNWIEDRQGIGNE